MTRSTLAGLLTALRDAARAEGHSHLDCWSGFARNLVQPLVHPAVRADAVAQLSRIAARHPAVAAALVAALGEDREDIPADAARSEQIRFRVTPAEQAEIIRRADDAGDTVTGYIRVQLGLDEL